MIVTVLVVESYVFVAVTCVPGAPLTAVESLTTDVVVTELAPEAVEFMPTLKVNLIGALGEKL